MNAAAWLPDSCGSPAVPSIGLRWQYAKSNRIASVVTAHILAGHAPDQAAGDQSPDDGSGLLARASPWAAVVACLCAESLRDLGEPMPEPTMTEHTMAECWPTTSLHGSRVSDDSQLERLATGWLGTQKEAPAGGSYAA